MSAIESKKQGKGIQCRECDVFSYIHAECTNTLKKKGKSLKTTWSDEDSNGSQEDDDDDDHVSNYLAFQVTFEKDAFGVVANSVATMTATSSKSDDVTICSRSVSKFNEYFESKNSDGGEQAQKISRKLIMKCTIIGSKFVSWISL